MHGGFVGMGMLDAACPGDVFTSPTPDQMEAATKAVNGGAGVLHIVKNYTGDVMNFQLAAELAADEGIAVETVLVDDDSIVIAYDDKRGEPRGKKKRGKKKASRQSGTTSDHMTRVLAAVEELRDAIHELASSKISHGRKRMRRHLSGTASN